MFLLNLTLCASAEPSSGSNFVLSQGEGSVDIAAILTQASNLVLQEVVNLRAQVVKLQEQIIDASIV